MIFASRDDWTEVYQLESNGRWEEKYLPESNDGLGEPYHSESIDSWAEQYQSHSNDSWSDIYGKPSQPASRAKLNDSWLYQTQSNYRWREQIHSQTKLDIQQSDDTLDEILEYYRPSVIAEYNSSAMLRMLNHTVIWGRVSQSDEAAKFNNFLDGLPTLDKHVMKDMEEWLADSVRSAEVFVEEEYGGFVNAKRTWCTYFGDLINFMVDFIVPRLRAQTQRQYAGLPLLKELVMGLKDSKLTHVVGC